MGVSTQGCYDGPSSMEGKAVALCLVYVEGGPAATPYRTRPADPPADKAEFTFEAFGTREEALVRARALIVGLPGLGAGAL